MRSLAWSLLALVVLGFGFLIGRSTAPMPHDRSVEPTGDTSSVAPAALFRMGLNLITHRETDISEDDKARAELLTQMAVTRQADAPESTTEIWSVFQSFLRNDGVSQELTSVSASEALSRLIAFQDSVEAAYAACRTQVQLDSVWKTRREVAAEIDRHRKQAIHDLAKDLVAILQPSNGTDEGASQALSAFAALATENERLLLTIVAADDHSASDQSELKPVFDAVDSLLALVETDLENVDSDCKSLLETSDEVSPTESVGKPSDGQCEMKLKVLDRLRTALDRSGLATWYTLKSQLLNDGDQPRLDEVIGRIDAIQKRLLQAQQLRYSLWALREIRNAETSESWIGLLAQIDPGQLHPTAAALFGSVQDRRTSDLKDAGQLQRMVRQMLTDPKVELRQF